MKLSLILLLVVEFAWLVGIDRSAGQYAVSIESTELWYNPWPAPGG